MEAICSFLGARTTELESAAYPALDELTSKVTEYMLTILYSLVMNLITPRNMICVILFEATSIIC